MWLVQLRDRISNKGDDRMKAMLLDICDAAIDKWGSDNQIMKAIEELCEFSVALCHLRLSRLGSTYEVMEEMADVEIMIAQLKRSVLDDQKIKHEDRREIYGKIYMEKIKRLREKVKENGL